MAETQETQETGKLLAKLAVIADPHLSCKDYGQHNDYPKESFHYLQKAGDTANKLGATHIIYAGDFSYGTFTDLEFRLKVEGELKNQSRSVGGRLWFLKGNHDKASFGMTEYEFYAERGLFRPSEVLQFGSTQIVMVDYGKEAETSIDFSQSKHTYVIGHNWYSFKDRQIPGKHIALDDMHSWYGIDGVISGHIHLESMDKGYIFNGDPLNPLGKEVFVWQLPSLPRPQYVNGIAEGTSGIALIEVYEKKVQIKRIEVELLPMEESFNMPLIEQRKADMEMSKTQYDFSQLMQDIRDKMAASNVHIDDILENLTGYTSGSGNPEDIIMGMEEADINARLKAVDLIKQAINLK